MFTDDREWRNANLNGEVKVKVSCRELLWRVKILFFSPSQGWCVAARLWGRLKMR